MKRRSRSLCFVICLIGLCIIGCKSQNADKPGAPGGMKMGTPRRLEVPKPAEGAYLKSDSAVADLRNLIDSYADVALLDLYLFIQQRGWETPSDAPSK